MYCVKCGVELADSERKCPLCATPVYFPELTREGERPYPVLEPDIAPFNPRGIYLIVSFVFLLSGLISAFADFNINGKIDWSGYVIGALAVAYTVFMLPLWFRRPSPAVFVPCDFAAAALYVLYICIATGGSWFLPFAMPIIGAAALIISAIAILCYYLRRGYLYIFGGAFIALGAFSIFIELMIHVTFDPHVNFVWSPYPAITFTLVGMLLIVVAIVKPFRESLARIFSL